MYLQSIPSPTRRRPRIAAALAIAFLFPRIKSSSEEFTSTGPNLDRFMEVEAAVPQNVEYEELLSWEPRGSGLRRRGEEVEFEDSPNLVPRQVVASSSTLPTTSATSPTASTVSPTEAIPTTAPPSSTSDLSATSTSSLPSSSSSAPSSTSTAVPVGYELPQPFDSTLGTNFSSTDCPSFFATFLADPDFVSCAPFSLLLGTSTGFFQAQRSPNSLLPYVLNASCSASIDTCSQLMDKYARQIKLQNTCGQDLSQGNPLATEALEGFQNYRLYREAGCQRSNSTEAPYCFVQASANSDPDGLYFYYLPEGTNLPSGTSATCEDSCTQGLLGIYARYAVNSTLPISKTYSSGRSVAALACGPEFAPLVTKVTSGSTRSLATHIISPTLILFALSLLLLLN